MSRRRVSKPRALKKKASQYKGASLIYAYYKRNKEYIDKNIDPIWVKTYKGDTYKAFKNLVIEKTKYKNVKTGDYYTYNESIRRVMNSKDMNVNLSASDIYKRNLMNKIKSDKELKAELLYKSSDEKKHTYTRKWRGHGEGATEWITTFKKGYNADLLTFEGYFNMSGKNAVVYSYDNDVYIAIYKSPKDSTGATFDFIPKKEFMTNLYNNRVIKIK